MTEPTEICRPAEILVHAWRARSYVRMRGPASQGGAGRALGGALASPRAWLRLRRNSWRGAGLPGSWRAGARAGARGVLAADWGSAAGAASALHHCTMSGPLEGCEREWLELEGEFQELQVRPGNLVPQLCSLRGSASAFQPCPVRPGPEHRALGAQGSPGPALGAGGPPGPDASHLPAAQRLFGAHVGNPPLLLLSRLSLPRASPAAQSCSVASEGQFQA